MSIWKDRVFYRFVEDHESDLRSLIEAPRNDERVKRAHPRFLIVQDGERLMSVPHSRRCSTRVARCGYLGDAGHMLRRLIQLLVGLFFLLGVFVGVVLGGMRSKSPPVLNAIRRFNRNVGNPRQMATAGSPGAYASVIRHVGRTSGQEYETPIGAIATEEGFVVALPYGANADWLKNLLASGSANIVDEGSTYRVDQPEVVAMAEAIDDFPPKERRMLRMFGVDKSLRVRRSELQDT